MGNIDVHSGPTPRGRDDSAAEAEDTRVLKSSNASILLMVDVWWVEGSNMVELCQSFKLS